MYTHTHTHTHTYINIYTYIHITLKSFSCNYHLENINFTDLSISTSSEDASYEDGTGSFWGPRTLSVALINP